jgi:putative flavoprotein involved in K+ transport
MYLMGMQFLRRRKSALIDGAADDARELSTHLASYLDGSELQLAHQRSPAADSLASLGF